MAQTSTEATGKKRSLHAQNDGPPGKHHRLGCQPTSLIGPHEAILAELGPKYHLLSASVISSSKIRQRTTSATGHLLSSEGNTRQPVVLLHARTECLTKLITIVETVKRVLSQEGKTWWQYNQLYDQPDKPEKRKDVVEETMLENGNSGGDEEDGYFETMGTRLEQAICPPHRPRAIKSLRVFLATGPVPELKAKSDTTMQMSSDGL